MMKNLRMKNYLRIKNQKVEKRNDTTNKRQ
jgi:hypothetical protein